MRVGHSTRETAEEVAQELGEQLGNAPAGLLVVFAAPDRDGAAIARALYDHIPGLSGVIGCSTAGEISREKTSMGGVSAAVLDEEVVRCAVALADYEGGVAAGVKTAVRAIESSLDAPLRTLDSARYAALVLIDSTNAVEEETHVQLGNHAPTLPFVGGSAGDNLAFASTTVFTHDRETQHGAVIAVLEMARPFRISKTCHFSPIGREHTVTRSEGRFLHELDGRPAAEVYAEHVGVAPAELSFDNLFANPIGLVIDGQPWIRQVNPPFHKEGSIVLGCELAQGSKVHFLKGNHDIVGHLATEMDAMRDEIGEFQGAILFDCALRRLEMEATDAVERYRKLLGFPVAGFHTHGESWIGHMHQTLTGLFIGKAKL